MESDHPQQQVANRVPPSAKRGAGSRDDGSSSSSSSSSKGEEQRRPSHQRPAALHRNKTYKRQKKITSTDQRFDLATQPARLDPTDPTHARRIESRRRAVAKGRNTAGYDAYLRQVPRDQRKPRSMETPMTPDPTLDVSAKRWQGLVRAWCVFFLGVDRDRVCLSPGN